MLKCVVVSTPGAKFSALAVKENLDQNIKKVAALGYDAVELAIRDPKIVDIREIKELLTAYHLTVPAIGTGQAYGEEGLSFTNLLPEIREAAIRRIKDQMDFAAQIGGAKVIIGLIRGTVKGGMLSEEAEEHFINAMRTCLDYRPDITLLLEPINRYETNLYNDITSAMTIIDTIDRPNLKLLIDTFHMNIEESDMIASIMKARDYIGHVHVADSNRWAPGCGHTNFKEIISTLRKIGYNGAISAEILPNPTPDECLKMTITNYNSLNII